VYLEVGDRLRVRARARARARARLVDLDLKVVLLVHASLDEDGVVL